MTLPDPAPTFDLPPATLRGEIATNRYGAYCVPLAARDRPVARAVLAGEVWEPKVIDLLCASKGLGDIVHAGAYFGDFLPALSRTCGTEHRVWAFEPAYDNARCARITILLNDLRNVELVRAALGDTESRARLVQHDEHGTTLGGWCHLTTDPNRGDDVPMTTIDATIPTDRHVAALHLDIEGAEAAALRGALQTIRRCRPVLVLEELPNHTLHDSPWFAENILALGYEKIGYLHENAVFFPVP